MSAHPALQRLPRVTATLGLVAAACLIGACGTKIGSQNNQGTGPTAVITVIGHKPTSAAGADPIAITVRSGADVILSGKDSEGTSAAIKSFDWTPDPSLPALPDLGALIHRTANTVSFRAPTVAAETVLNFTLTVTDARDASKTAHAKVTVEPASDPSQFLLSPLTTHRVTVAVLTVDGLGTTKIPKQTLQADAPVCIQLGRQILYKGRNLGSATPAITLSSLQAETAWAKGSVIAGTGSSTVEDAVKDYSNPRVTFDVPSFNDEEIFARFNQPVGANLNAQLNPADVDSALLQVTVSAVAGTCAQAASAAPSGAAANSQLIVTVLDGSGFVSLQSSPAGNGAAALAPISSDALLMAATPSANQPVGKIQAAAIETAASADAYYDAIDPNHIKLKLSDWLAANCFDPSASDYGVSKAPTGNAAHAVYVNNFDLGFGRDMYFMRCGADQQVNGNTTAHAGDMASVVLNYTSLEQAALKQAPFLAVAMEYSAAADGSNPDHRFTKFYVFAPDDLTGEFVRVRTANFDHRGQKYVPGACIACHGGTRPNLPATFSGPAPGSTASACSASSYSLATCYPLVQDPRKGAVACAAGSAPGTPGCLPAGDIDSAFLPWDLDAFLYADVGSDPAFTGLLVNRAGYTRDAQEASLKALNLLAYSTWRFATDSTGNAVPELEEIGGSTSSPKLAVDRYAAAKALIEHWYGGTGLPNAKYADFTDSAPPDGWSGQPTSQPLYHSVFARNCRTCHTVEATPATQFSGLQPNVPGDAYQDGYSTFIAEFTDTNSGNRGKGRDYIFQQGVMPHARLTMDRFWVDYDNPTALSAANKLAAALGLSGAQAVLGASHAQAIPQVNDQSISPDKQLDCTTTPSGTVGRGDKVRLSAAGSAFPGSYSWTLQYVPCENGFASQAPLVGPAAGGLSNSEAAFSPDVPGIYTATVNVGDSLGADSVAYAFRVPDRLPSITGPASNSPSFINPTPIPLMVSLGDGTCQEHSVSLVASSGSVVAGACVAPTGGMGDYTIPLAYTPVQVGAATITAVLRDVDQESSAPFTINLNVTSSLSASSVTGAATAGLSPSAVPVCVSVASSGQAFTIEVASSAGGTYTSLLGPTGAGGKAEVKPAGSANCSGQTYIEYTPPPQYIGADSFSYHAKASGSQVSDPAGVSVSTSGTVSFATIFGVLKNGGDSHQPCADCHAPSGVVATKFLPTAASSSVLKQYYEHLCGTAGGQCIPQATASVNPLIDLGTPSNSELVVAPTAPTPSATMPTYPTFVTAVQTWISEGAYCTTTGSACPTSP